MMKSKSENIYIGMELPKLYKCPNTRQLVQYSGSSFDYYEIHYDKDIAIQNDLPGVIVHGALKAAFLGELVTKWMEPTGKLLKLVIQYKGIDIPDDELMITGKVYKLESLPVCKVAYCSLWLENSSGERTTTGSAIVQFNIH